MKMAARRADLHPVDRCASCGATLASGSAWCGQCFALVPGNDSYPGEPGSLGGAPVGTLATLPAGTTGTTVTATNTVAPARPFVPAAANSVEPAMRVTRWGKTPTTFGPIGRCVATAVLILVLIGFIVGGIADPFAWAGAAIWGGVITPWGLRDIWKAGRVPVA